MANKVNYDLYARVYGRSIEFFLLIQYFYLNPESFSWQCFADDRQKRKFCLFHEKAPAWKTAGAHINSDYFFKTGRRRHPSSGTLPKTWYE